MRMQLILLMAFTVVGCSENTPEFSPIEYRSIKDVKGVITITLSDTKNSYAAKVGSENVEQFKRVGGPAYPLAVKENKTKKPLLKGSSEARLVRPYAIGPDGKFLASGIAWVGMDPETATNILGILEYPGGAVRAEYKAPEMYVIESIAWAPNSEMIAVLTRRSTIGKFPGDILASVAGHPVSYLTFALEIIKLDGSKVMSLNLGSNFQSGFGFVSWN